MSQDQPQELPPRGGIIGELRAEASASVSRGAHTLARIAAGELNPDGTPAGKDGK